MFVPLIISIFSGNVNAIIIRHDVDDVKYIDLGNKYSSSVAYINGCAGTLVGGDWILTAAHCVHGSENKLFFASHLDQKYRVEKVVVHPKYGLENNGRHDIALVQLKEEVENGKPAKLYEITDESDKPVVFVGKGGFGNGRDGPIEFDKTQRGATNTIIGTDEYWIEFKFDSAGDATELEGISGPGDSGGPAFITIASELYVAGVSSFQNNNGSKEGTYGVSEYYTRVSSYTEWIHSAISDAEAATAIPDHPVIDAIKSNNAELLNSALNSEVLNNEIVMREAFFQSVILDRVSMGEEMIVRGANLRSVDFSGNSLFELAILAEREDYLKMLVFKFRHLKNIHRENSEILLMVVAEFGDKPQVLEFVDILLDQGANVNVQTSQGDTAVILAGWLTNNLDLLALLVERGADVNIPNKNGDTPIIDAAYKGKNEFLEYLLRNGANKDVKNNAGLSAIDMAREAENLDAIKMLESKSNDSR
jgi:ankyrin repeat protein